MTDAVRLLPLMYRSTRGKLIECVHVIVACLSVPKTCTVATGTQMLLYFIQVATEAII